MVTLTTGAEQTENALAPESIHFPAKLAYTVLSACQKVPVAHASEFLQVDSTLCKRVGQHGQSLFGR